MGEFAMNVRLIFGKKIMNAFYAEMLFFLFIRFFLENIVYLLN